MLFMELVMVVLPDTVHHTHFHLRFIHHHTVRHQHLMAGYLVRQYPQISHHNILLYMSCYTHHHYEEDTSLLLIRHWYNHHLIGMRYRLHIVSHHHILLIDLVFRFHNLLVR